MRFWVFCSKHSSVTNRDCTTCPRAAEAGLKATHGTVWPASLDCAVTQICLLKGQKIKQPTGSPDMSDQWCFLLSTPNGKKPPWTGEKLLQLLPLAKCSILHACWLGFDLIFFPTQAQGASLWLHPPPSSMCIRTSGWLSTHHICPMHAQGRPCWRGWQWC